MPGNLEAVVTDKKEGRQRPLAEVKESIEKLLKNKKSRKAKAKLLKRLKSEGKVETFLPKAPISAKAVPTPKAIQAKGKLPANIKNGGETDELFSMSALDQEVNHGVDPRDLPKPCDPREVEAEMKRLKDLDGEVTFFTNTLTIF